MIANWVVGVLLAMAASIISNAGLNLQKLNHSINEQRIRVQIREGRRKAAEEQKQQQEAPTLSAKPAYPSALPPIQQDQQAASQSTPLLATPSLDAYSELNRIDYSKQRLWRAGLGLVTIGSLLDFVALTFAAQSIIAPLGSLTLVSNTVFAPLMLGETVSRRDFLATLAIVVGSVVAVIFADHADNEFTVLQLFSFFTTTRFVVYATVVAAAIGLLFTWKRQLTHVRITKPRRYDELGLARYHRFTYAALSGIIGAQSVLFAKCTGGMLLSTLARRGDFMLAYWQTYFILLGLVVSIYFQISYLNSGLRNFESLFIVPVFQSFWILVSVVGGMIFFAEYRRVFDEPASSFGFPIGVLITIAGVYVLSQRGGASSSASARSTPLQRNYKHYGPAAHTSSVAPSSLEFGGFPTRVHVIDVAAPPLVPGCDDDDSLLAVSPAPPLGFMSAFLEPRFAPVSSLPHSWHGDSHWLRPDATKEVESPRGEYASFGTSAPESLRGHLTETDRTTSRSSTASPASAPARVTHAHAPTHEIDAADIVDDASNPSVSPAPIKPSAVTTKQASQVAELPTRSRAQ